MKLVLAILLTVFVAHTYAWWCQGHRIVFEIARQQLHNETKDDIIKAVDTILLNMTEHDAGKVLDMIPCWLDDIKDNGGMYWSGIYHYVDIPYVIDDLNITVHPQANASGAIRETLKTIHYKKCPSHLDCMLAKSIMYRGLIHLVGDIHQPMHAVNRFTKKTPHGDAGGNLFKIKFTDSIHNLHFLWDAIVGLDGGSVTPVDVMKKNASDIMKVYPKDHYKEQVKNLNVDVWAKESNEAAIHYAYEGIQEDSSPSPTYLKNRQEVAKERLALAGYRLAAVFEEAYKIQQQVSEEEDNEINDQ